MASIPANSSDWSREHAGDREQRLNQIIADYLEAQRRASRRTAAPF